MAYHGEDIILIGIIIGGVLAIIILAAILERCFPKNKISKKFEKLAEWIKDNVQFT